MKIGVLNWFSIDLAKTCFQSCFSSFGNEKQLILGNIKQALTNNHYWISLICGSALVASSDGAIMENCSSALTKAQADHCSMTASSCRHKSYNYSDFSIPYWENISPEICKLRWSICTDYNLCNNRGFWHV